MQQSLRFWKAYRSRKSSVRLATAQCLMGPVAGFERRSISLSLTSKNHRADQCHAKQQAVSAVTAGSPLPCDSGYQHCQTISLSERLPKDRPPLSLHWNQLSGPARMQPARRSFRCARTGRSERLSKRVVAHAINNPNNNKNRARALCYIADVFGVHLDPP